jgi:retron-type reverse transcriptase
MTINDAKSYLREHWPDIRRWDPTFSEHSYGFRPGRSAHQAATQAQRYVAEGYSVVVDLDLERFLYAASYCPPTHED